MSTLESLAWQGFVKKCLRYWLYFLNAFIKETVSSQVRHRLPKSRLALNLLVLPKYPPCERSLAGNLPFALFVTKDDSK